MNMISPSKAYNANIYGRLKEEFGITDHITKEQYDRIFEAKEVDNRRVKKEKQNAGFELVLSPPKSVSIAALVYNNKDIIDAHVEAEREVMKWIENHYTEYYKNNEFVQTQDYVAVSFMHTTSRPVEGIEDPHLHSHLKLMNIVKTKDNSFKAPILTSVFHEQGTIKAVYDNALGFSLMRRGYKLRQTKSNFELANMPQEYISKFSSRSNQIKEKIDSGASEKAAFFSTREEKNDTFDKNELIAKWREGLDMSLDFKGINTVNTISMEEIIKDSIEQCLKQEMFFTKNDVIKKAKPFLIGRSFDEFYDKLKETLEDDSYIKHYKRDFFTTKEMIRVEKRNLSTLKYSSELYSNVKTVEIMISEYERRMRKELNSDFTLTAEQKNVIVTIMSNKHKLIGVQGDAGSGKTFMLKSLKAIADESNIKVVGLSFQNAAVREMQDAGLEDTRTIDSMIYSKMKFEEKAIYIIDEVSMLDAVKFDKLLSKIPKKAKIVMLGDDKQLVPINGGIPFSESKKLGMPLAELTTNYRQKDSDKFADVEGFVLKDATATLKDYIVNKKNEDIVLETFDKVTVEKEESERNKDILDYYMGKYKEKKDGTKILTHTNKRRLELNSMIHNELFGDKEQFTFKIKRKMQIDSTLSMRTEAAYELGMYFEYKNHKGIISDIDSEKLTFDNGNFIKFEEIKDRFDLVHVYKEEDISLTEGDQIIFTETSKSKYIKNSEMGTIESINGDEIEVRTYSDKDVGKLKKFNIKNFNSLDYGYTITTFKSQGKTFENVIIDMNQTSSKLQQFYVGVTRAKYNIRIFTDNKVNFLKNALHNAERKRSLIDYKGRLNFKVKDLVKIGMDKGEVERYDDMAV